MLKHIVKVGCYETLSATGPTPKMYSFLLFGVWFLAHPCQCTVGSYASLSVPVRNVPH